MYFTRLLTLFLAIFVHALGGPPDFTVQTVIQSRLQELEVEKSKLEVQLTLRSRTLAMVREILHELGGEPATAIGIADLTADESNCLNNIGMMIKHGATKPWVYDQIRTSVSLPRISHVLSGYLQRTIARQLSTVSQQLMIESICDHYRAGEPIPVSLHLALVDYRFARIRWTRLPEQADPSTLNRLADLIEDRKMRIVQLEKELVDTI